jgi:hypothetical protein
MAPAVEEKKTKVMVPRKKLQSVPDLLARGEEGQSTAESVVSKLLWMTFLVVSFFISFEIFNRMFGVPKSESGDYKSDL